MRLKRFLEKADLRVESIDRTGGGHYKAVCSYGNITRFIILPASPSDHRWERNKLSEIKKTYSVDVAHKPDT